MYVFVQFAKKMGFRTIAIGKSADKSPLAHQLGADIYIGKQEIYTARVSVISVNV